MFIRLALLTGLLKEDSHMNISSRLLAASLVVCTAFVITTVAEGAIFVMIPGVQGDTRGPDGGNNWFTADSFSFGVEREMKESAEKGGTEDINIGIGELQECTISKSMDSASAQLAQFAINGNSLGAGDICFSSGTDAAGIPNCYLRYKLERAWVKSWSTSGDADDRPTEEVAFYYNKIAFAYQTQDQNGNTVEGSMSWEKKKKRSWLDGLKDIFDLITGTPPER